MRDSKCNNNTSVHSQWYVFLGMFAMEYMNNTRNCNMGMEDMEYGNGV